MVTPIDLGDLARAFGVDRGGGRTSDVGSGRGELISLVGGGGKTTTLFTLGDQLGGTTVLTTTTKMGSEQSKDYPALIDPTDAELRARLLSDHRVLAWKGSDGRRATGVNAETCDRWFDLATNVVVEADGSRKRPFKAPASHEPVIPSRTTLLVACIGASALGKPIADSCHRPDLVAALAECSVQDLLTPARAALVLLSRDGSQKGRPEGARFLVALHRVGPRDLTAAAALRDQLGDKVGLVAVAQVPDRPAST